MRYAVTADWHIQNSGMFSSPLANGITTRAMLSFDFIDWFQDFCESEDVHAVLHAGDFFTLKNHISIPLFNRTYDRMMRFEPMILVVPGNHDRYLKAEGIVHSLHAMNRGIHRFEVLDEDRYRLIVGDTEIIGIPGGCLDREFFLSSKVNKRRVLLIHENLIGATFASGSKITEGVSPKDLTEIMKEHQIDFCFSGDIHKWQWVKKKPPILYVGSPYQLDFGDEGQQRGVWIYESDTNEVEFHHYPGAPEFETIEDQQWHDRRDEIVADITDMMGPLRYYKFRFNSLRLANQVLSLLEGYENQFIMDTVSESEKEGKSFSAFHDPDDLIEEWVEMSGEIIQERELDPERLIKQGKEFVARVNHGKD